MTTSTHTYLHINADEARGQLSMPPSMPKCDHHFILSRRRRTPISQ